jgi:ribosomal protein S12 methylthiotransferase
MKKINVITLGCSKNTVDSEHLMAQLAAAGYKLEHDSDRTDADVVVINTCGFIGDAKQESIDTILSAVRAKEEGNIEQLFVIGCLSERYADELREEIPEVDEYFGVNDWADIVAALGGTHSEELATERVLTTPSHYAYLKIGEGCNWLCGYCAIPLIRGKHVSVPIEQILEEAKALAAKGVKELMVIAQDTTYYGIDLYGRRRLADVLTELCRIEGIEWIRLHYAYPAAFPEDVIEVMAREPKICKYLDIPFQHISDHMLSAMKRRHTKAEAMELVSRLRRLIPDIALRTTLLVGYPGETLEDIAELEEFVREVRFDRLGVFPYSEEEGTYSATELTDDVPEEEKERRAARIMQIQEQISLENNLSRVGRVMRVIVDSRQGDYYVARSEYDSPEVDQEILIPCELRQLRRGKFYDVRITGAEDYDLFGEVIAASSAGSKR